MPSSSSFRGSGAPIQSSRWALEPKGHPALLCGEGCPLSEVGHTRSFQMLPPIQAPPGRGVENSPPPQGVWGQSPKQPRHQSDVSLKSYALSQEFMWILHSMPPYISVCSNIKMFNPVSSSKTDALGRYICLFCAFIFFYFLVFLFCAFISPRLLPHTPRGTSALLKSMCVHSFPSSVFFKRCCLSAGLSHLRRWTPGYQGEAKNLGSSKG